MMYSNINTKNIALTITPENSVSLTRDTVDFLPTQLFKRAKANDSETQLKLAMLFLCENKIGFAEVFLRKAAKNRNKRAKKYLSLLHDLTSEKDNKSTNRLVDINNSFSLWRTTVIDLEAKFIVFGKDND